MEELKENIRREIANIPAEGKSEFVPPVRGIFTCRGTAFSTPSMICEQR
jgi:hypothetical protein